MAPFLVTAGLAGALMSPSNLDRRSASVTSTVDGEGGQLRPFHLRAGVAGPGEWSSTASELVGETRDG